MFPRFVGFRSVGIWGKANRKHLEMGVSKMEKTKQKHLEGDWTNFLSIIFKAAFILLVEWVKASAILLERGATFAAHRCKAQYTAVLTLNLSKASGEYRQDLVTFSACLLIRSSPSLQHLRCGCRTLQACASCSSLLPPRGMLFDPGIPLIVKNDLDGSFSRRIHKNLDLKSQSSSCLSRLK